MEDAHSFDLCDFLQIHLEDPIIDGVRREQLREELPIRELVGKTRELELQLKGGKHLANERPHQLS